MPPAATWLSASVRPTRLSTHGRALSGSIGGHGSALTEKLLEVPAELVRTAIGLELTEGTVIADNVGETPCLFLASLHRAERGIAERLMRLANGTELSQLNVVHRPLLWQGGDPQRLPERRGKGRSAVNA